MKYPQSLFAALAISASLLSFSNAAFADTVLTPKVQAFVNANYYPDLDIIIYGAPFSDGSEVMRANIGYVGGPVLRSTNWRMSPDMLSRLGLQGALELNVYKEANYICQLSGNSPAALFPKKVMEVVLRGNVINGTYQCN
jgi:hypothetical protein